MCKIWVASVLKKVTTARYFVLKTAWDAVSQIVLHWSWSKLFYHSDGSNVMIMAEKTDF